MKKYGFLIIGLSALLLNACQTIESLSIDYMLPAEISFPANLKKVGIVNNTSPLPDNTLLPEKGKSLEKKDEIQRQVAYNNGRTDLTTNSLAQTIADQNYFEVVVICDSALRANDYLPRETTLTREEVDELTKNLNVDFLIALEGLEIKAVRTINYILDWGLYQGTIDTKVYPTVKIYVPGRETPMTTVNASDSIFWEEFEATRGLLDARLVSDSVLIEEASEFAGTVPVKHLLPYWKTANRTLYASGSVNMRDAAVYVRENSWDKAATLWEKEFNTAKSKKKKMYAASNLALHYEMKDSIEQAEKWAVEAQNLAREIDRIDKRTHPVRGVAEVPNYFQTTLYVTELKQRKAGMPKLKLQMQRFNEDF